MKKKLKAIKLLLLVIIVVGGGFGYYNSRYLSPDSYSLKKDTITNNLLPNEFNNFEIGFISDLNLSDNDDLLRFKQIIKTLNKENVDLVIFGGDLFTTNPFDNSQVISLLTSIKSNYGKFAVLGEKDLVNLNDITSILNEGGFEVLNNEYRPLYYNGASISLFGLKDNGDISGLLNEVNNESYKLVVVHEPDYFDTSATSDIALQLSGHTMGGYIALPGLGGLIKRDHGTKYVNGIYRQGNSKLLISNGLGMELEHNYRLFCPNQINIIKLKK